MDYINNNAKISLIKKYYKHSKIFLELALLNYSGYNLYILLTKSKKYKNYRLSWFDLDEIKEKNIDKYLSCSYIDNKVIDAIENIYSNFEVNAHYTDEALTDKDIVILKGNIKIASFNDISIQFKKYIPKSLANLTDIFLLVFQNMPRRYEPFLYKLLAKLTDSTERYEYKEEFSFDLFNEEINKIFKYPIIQRGKQYYEEGKIKFLEKIENRYFAIVEGTEKYVVIIKYNEQEKRMQVYCTCPCEFI